MLFTALQTWLEPLQLVLGALPELGQGRVFLTAGLRLGMILLNDKRSGFFFIFSFSFQIYVLPKAASHG
jgi:hypothetical protein